MNVNRIECWCCKGTGKMYEINYMSWYDPKDAPKTLDELIDERPCSFCMGNKIIEKKE